LQTIGATTTAKKNFFSIQKLRNEKKFLLFLLVERRMMDTSKILGVILLKRKHNETMAFSLDAIFPAFHTSDISNRSDPIGDLGTPRSRQP
jgi:hypothetical protein